MQYSSNGFVLFGSNYDSEVPGGDVNGPDIIVNCVRCGLMCGTVCCDGCQDAQNDSLVIGADVFLDFENYIQGSTGKKRLAFDIAQDEDSFIQEYSCGSGMKRVFVDLTQVKDPVYLVDLTGDKPVVTEVVKASEQVDLSASPIQLMRQISPIPFQIPERLPFNLIRHLENKYGSIDYSDNESELGLEELLQYRYHTEEVESAIADGCDKCGGYINDPDRYMSCICREEGGDEAIESIKQSVKKIIRPRSNCTECGLRPCSKTRDGKKVCSTCFKK